MSPVITLLRAALIAALFTSLSLLGVSGLLDAVPARAATLMKLLAAVKTVAGQNRFDTAIKVSQAQAPTTSATVFLVNGYAYPDALAAGPAAAKEHAPVLLTTQASLLENVRSELVRLQPAKVILIGNEQVLSAAVRAEVSAALPNANVTRVAGDNRHDTAARIAETWFPDPTSAFIANGWNFPDAISAAAAGAHTGQPVLLSPTQDLPPEAANYLRGHSLTRLTVLGSASSMSNTVVASAALASPGARVDRVGGSDRYETNALLMEQFFDSSTSPGAVVTTGQDYPDALVASAYSTNGFPVFLTTSNCATQAVRTQLESFVAASDRSLIRVGNSIALGAWETRCGDLADYNNPGSLTDPATGLSRLAPYEVTPGELANFVEQYNLMRVAQGYPALPLSQFVVGTGCWSEKESKQVAAMEQSGQFPADPHAGKCGTNEVAWNAMGNTQYFEFDGSDPAAAWMFSPQHRALLYPERQIAGTVKIAVNISRGPSSFAAAAAWVGPTELASGTFIPALTAAPELARYTPPSGTGAAMTASERDGLEALWRGRYATRGTPMVVPSTVRNVGSASPVPAGAPRG